MTWSASIRRLLGATLATLLVTGAAQAAILTKTFDVSGIGSYGELGDAQNQTRSLFIGAGANIIGLSWNVQLTSDNPSWLADLGVSLSNANSDELFLFPGVADLMSGSGSYSGSVDHIDIQWALGSDFVLGNDGFLFLEFFEYVDDFAGLDGLWLSGNLSILANVVPTPAGLALVAVALFAAGANRRRSLR